MTADTGDAVVLGQPLVVKQLVAQRDLARVEFAVERQGLDRLVQLGVDARRSQRGNRGHGQPAPGALQPGWARRAPWDAGGWRVKGGHIERTNGGVSQA